MASYGSDVVIIAEDRHATDIEQVQLEKKLYTLP
jgi:hypothetical protein